MIKKLFQKACGRAYAIGYRTFFGETIGNSKWDGYEIIMPTKEDCYADPFPVIYNEKKYIFCEIIDRETGRGSIGVYCIGENEKPIEIIAEPFHMSYPNVFQYNGEFYMIPETSEAQELRIYKAKKFPYEWELNKILLDNVKLVDFSFCKQDKDFYAVAQDISCEKFYNRFFKFNMNDKTITELYYGERSLIDKRPGGNIIVSDEKWYIPLQDCENCYGEYLRFVETTPFFERNIYQKEIFQLKSSMITLEKRLMFDRVHTYNRANDLEVIDVYAYLFTIKKLINKIMRRVRG